ncbi:hypothetical protein F511_21921 [Dorcoceras hygrometricum]|uniref:Uncharacterized protein n=1 Tax=Dorcoceras hygrometricum TaxID=472368 RepID=A0A2Z7AR80_9LAMI|nr:hypothetical protein F511_21921 [Dorcoceras hygrometricum]
MTFTKRRRTRVQFNSNLMFAKLCRISSTQPTPNLIYYNDPVLLKLNLRYPVLTRLLEAELAQTRKSINLFQARSGLPVTYNEQSSDLVAFSDITPCLTWEMFKAQIAKLTNPPPDRQTDQDKEHQDTESCEGKQVDEIGTNDTSLSLSPSFNLGPNPDSKGNHTDHQGPSTSNLQMVVYTTNNEVNNRPTDEHREVLPNLVERFRDDAGFKRHSTVQLRKQLKNAVDGLGIKIYPTTSCDEVTMLKSQVAEVVECLKELRDAKKGEGK